MSTPNTPFWKPGPATSPELRKFGLLFAGLAAALGAWKAFSHPPDATFTASWGVPVLVSAALILVSVAVPRVLFPAWWPWMVLVHVLGFVNSHLLLALVFYLLFTPLGLLMRLFGKDPLGDRDFTAARRTAAAGGSLWHRREATALDPEHFARQF